MASATELANQALIKLGSKMISNIEAPVSAAGNICAELLQPALDVFTTSFRWSWADAVSVLDPVAEPDPEPVDYEYQYEVPTDFLQLLSLKTPENTEITDYRINAGTTIECDYDEIKLYYKARIEATSLPPSEIDAFTSYLAHRLSPGIDGGKRANIMYQEYMQKVTMAFMEDASQRKEPVDSEDYFSGS